MFKAAHINDERECAKGYPSFDHQSSYMKRIDAIILAGGLGKRLQEVVKDQPKVLAQVNGRPFLDIILGSLSSYSMIGRVVLAIGYMAEQIIEEYGQNSSYPFDINFSVEKTLLGTGGGIKKALSLTKTQKVIVLNGDSFTDVNLDELVKFHDSVNAKLTMTITKANDTSRFGSVVLDGMDRVAAFREKIEDEKSGYINAGVYLLERSIFDTVNTDVPISLERELLPQFLKSGVYGFITKGKFIDIGTPESYRAAGFLFKKD
jgi:D-glycero-alpha-D-manno-heptose 1-phosphate guanylyltransferase